MLLTADVGNTNIKLGLFGKDELRYKMRFNTNGKMTADEYSVMLYTFFQIHGIDHTQVDGSIISSVVPKVTQPLLDAIELVTGVRSMVIGPGLKSGMALKIDRPETLGGDIVCGCVGAFEKYGGPLITVFMGTATVITYVDEHCAYHGGVIAPGVGISLDALTSGGALLPAVDLQTPKKIIGTNTVDCMRSGVVIGAACMLDGMIDRFMAETGKACRIIATGGLAKNIIPSCTHEIVYEENIILDGLRSIFEKNRK